MGFIGWIVLGLIAGAIAKAILKDKAAGGWFGSLVVGVVGAAVGGWIGSAIFNIGLENFWSLQTWLVAILGSLLVLLVYGWISDRNN